MRCVLLLMFILLVYYFSFLAETFVHIVSREQKVGFENE